PGFGARWRDHFQAALCGQSGQRARWEAIKKGLQQLDGTCFSRNQILKDPAIAYQRLPAQTNYNLQEYFVPAAEFSNFVNRVRTIVPKHQAVLNSVMVRYVREDRDTFLRYADRDMFSFAMWFLQARTPAGETDMQALTQELIDAALASSGRFYLPYRLH